MFREQQREVHMCSTDATFPQTLGCLHRYRRLTVILHPTPHPTPVSRAPNRPKDCCFENWWPVENTQSAPWSILHFCLELELLLTLGMGLLGLSSQGYSEGTWTIAIEIPYLVLSHGKPLPPVMVTSHPGPGSWLYSALWSYHLYAIS